jgi:hypothetical protein
VGRNLAPPPSLAPEVVPVPVVAGLRQCVQRPQARRRPALADALAPAGRGRHADPTAPLPMSQPRRGSAASPDNPAACFPQCNRCSRAAMHGSGASLHPGAATPGPDPSGAGCTQTRRMSASALVSSRGWPTFTGFPLPGDFGFPSEDSWQEEPSAAGFFQAEPHPRLAHGVQTSTRFP